MKSSPFWKAQCLIWPLYGVGLMLPWLGVFSVHVMLPNKAVIVISGMLISATMRTAYNFAARRGVGPEMMLGLVIGASMVGGVAWNGLLLAVLGTSDSLLGIQQGILGSGIPQFAGASYHALVLLSWSMSYLGFKHLRAAYHVQYSVQPMHVVLSDGKRKVFLRGADIRWVAAERDYVRVHTGEKQLLFRVTMSSLERLLPVSEFVRIHRSTIVRVDQIRELTPLPNNEYRLQLRDGTVLKVSRTFAHRVRSLLDTD